MPFFLLAAAAVASPMQGPAWMGFSRFRSSDHVREAVEIGSGRMAPGEAFHYVLRLTRSVPTHGRPRTTEMWADGATCPAVRAILGDMRAVALPRLAPLGVPGSNETVVLDGSQYVLTAPTSDDDGSVTINSNSDSETARWIDSSLDRLAVCWSRTGPR